MEKVLKWLAEAAAEKFIKLAFALAATGIGGIALLSFYTYIREFWERDPILTGFYSVICILSGIGIGMLINLSKYLIFKRELEEEVRKRAEEEAKQKRRKEEELKKSIEEARERVEKLTQLDKWVLKFLYEKGNARTRSCHYDTSEEFTYMLDLVDITETDFNECVISLTKYGKFCAKHSQDILAKVKKPKTDY